MSVVSEQIATIIIGASLYMLRSSLKLREAETHVAVILSFIRRQLRMVRKAEGHTTEATAYFVHHFPSDGSNKLLTCQ